MSSQDVQPRSQDPQGLSEYDLRLRAQRQHATGQPDEALQQAKAEIQNRQQIARLRAMLAELPDDSASTEQILRTMREDLQAEQQQLNQEFFRAVEAQGLSQEFQAQKLAQLNDQNKQALIQQMGQLVNSELYDPRVPEQTAYVSEMLHSFDEGTQQQYLPQTEQVRQDAMYKIARGYDEEELGRIAVEKILPVLREQGFGLAAGKSAVQGVLGGVTNPREMLEDELNRIIRKGMLDRFEPENVPDLGWGDIIQSKGAEIPILRKEVYQGRDPKEWEERMRSGVVRKVMRAVQESGDLEPSELEQLGLNLSSFIGGATIPIPALGAVNKIIKAKGLAGFGAKAVATGGLAGGAQRAINEVFGLPDNIQNRLEDIEDPQERERMESAAKWSVALETGLMAPLMGSTASLVTKPGMGLLKSSGRLGATMPAVTDAVDLIQQAVTDSLSAAGLDVASDMRKAEQEGVLPERAYWAPESPEQMGAVRQLVNGVIEYQSTGDFTPLGDALLNYAKEAGTAATAFGLMGMASRIVGAPEVRDVMSLDQRQQFKKTARKWERAALTATEQAPDWVFTEAGTTREAQRKLIRQQARDMIRAKGDFEALGDDLGPEEAQNRLDRLRILERFPDFKTAVEQTGKAREAAVDKVVQRALDGDDAMEAAQDTRDPQLIEAMRAQRSSEMLTGEAQREAQKARDQALIDLEADEPGLPPQRSETLREDLRRSEAEEQRAQRLRRARPPEKADLPAKIPDPTPEKVDDVTAWQQRKQVPTPASGEGGGGKIPPHNRKGGGGEDPGKRRSPDWESAEEYDDPQLIPPRKRRPVGFWESLRGGDIGIQVEDFSKPDPKDPHRSVLGLHTRWIAENLGLPTKFAPVIAPLAEQAQIKIAHTQREMGVDIRRMFQRFNVLKDLDTARIGQIHSELVDKGLKLPGDAPPRGGRQVADELFIEMMESDRGSAVWQRVGKAAAEGDASAKMVLDVANEGKPFFESFRKAAMEVNDTLRQWEDLIRAHERRIIEIGKNYEKLGKAERAEVTRRKKSIEQTKEKLYEFRKNFGIENYFPHMLKGEPAALEKGRKRFRELTGEDVKIGKPGSLQERTGAAKRIDEVLRAAGYEGILNRNPEEVMSIYAAQMSRYIVSMEFLSTVKPLLYGKLDFVREVNGPDGGKIHEGTSPVTGLNSDNYVYYNDGGTLVQMRNHGLHTDGKGRPVVVLEHAGRKKGIAAKKLSDPKYVDSLRKHQSVTVMPQWKAEQFLMTMRGGWTQEILKYAAENYDKMGPDGIDRAQKRIAAIERYIERVVFGKMPGKQRVGTFEIDEAVPNKNLTKFNGLERLSMKFADAAAADFDFYQRTYANWLTGKAPRWLSQLISMGSMGMDMTASWTVFGGGHWLNRMDSSSFGWYPKGIGQTYRRMMVRGAGDAVAKWVERWFDTSFVKRIEQRIEAGKPTTGLYSEFLGSLGEQMRTAPEKLAKMKPENAAEVRLHEDAYVAGLKSGIIDVSVFDDIMRGRRPWEVKKLYQKVGDRALRGIDLIKTAWMANVIAPENSVRMKGFMDKYIESIREGKSPERATVLALHRVAGTQRSFQSASLPRYMDNFVVRLAGTLGRWAALYGQRELFGGRGIRQRLGRPAKKYPYMLAGVYLGSNLGNIYDYLNGVLTGIDREDDEKYQKLIANLNRNLTNMFGAEIGETPGLGYLAEGAAWAGGLDAQATEELLASPSPLITPPAGTAGLTFLDNMVFQPLKHVATGNLEKAGESAMRGLRDLNPAEWDAVKEVLQWIDSEEVDDKFVRFREDGTRIKETDFDGWKQFWLDMMPGMASAEQEAWTWGEVAWRQNERQQRRNRAFADKTKEWGRTWYESIRAKGRGDTAKKEFWDTQKAQVLEELVELGVEDPQQARKLLAKKTVGLSLAFAKRALKGALEEYYLTRDLRPIAKINQRDIQVDRLTKLMQAGKVTPPQLARFLGSVNENAAMTLALEFDAKGREVTKDDIKDKALPFRRTLDQWVSTESVTPEHMQAFVQTFLKWSGMRQTVESGR